MSGSRLRTTLAAAARDFYHQGWMLGTAGNLSARRKGGNFWITASGRPKDALEDEDFVAMDLEGQVLEAHSGRRPSAESAIHQVIYRNIPTAGVILHVHSVEANLCGHMAAQGLLRLPPLEMLKGLGIPEGEPEADLPVFANHASVPEIASEMDAFFQAGLPRVPGVLIHLHGVTVWGGDIVEARHHLELLEFCFRYLVQAGSLGLGVQK